MILTIFTLKLYESNESLKKQVLTPFQAPPAPPDQFQLNYRREM